MYDYCAWDEFLGCFRNSTATTSGGCVSEVTTIGRCLLIKGGFTVVDSCIHIDAS